MVAPSSVLLYRVSAPALDLLGRPESSACPLSWFRCWSAQTENTCGVLPMGAEVP